MDMDGLLTEAVLQTLAPRRESTGSVFIRDDNRFVKMCYVPMQQWEELYDDETAYMTGTAFPSLNKPFMGGGR